MAGPAGILLEIHRLHILARDLQKRLDFAPKQLNAQQSVLGKREEELKQGHEAIKKAKITIHEHEVSVKAAQQQIKKYEQQIGDITSKKEYDALRHEIAGVNDKIRAIEDETLTAMMVLEELNGRIPALEEEVNKAKAELAAFEREFQAKLGDWTKARDEAAAQCGVEEAKLSEDVRTLYDRLVKAMGADALAAVEGKSCTFCFTELTAQAQHNVLLRQFVSCRNCGRILYLKD